MQLRRVKHLDWQQVLKKCDEQEDHEEEVAPMEVDETEPIMANEWNGSWLEAMKAHEKKQVSRHYS